MKLNFKSLRGHIIGIIFITLITTTASVVHGLNQAELQFETTAFLSIGHKYESRGELSAYETVRAADHYKETVQGWFKNPSFLNRIFAKAGTSSALSARNQEKQNILITFKTANEKSAEKLADSIEDTLLKEISEYNLKTGSEFTLALYDYTIVKTSDKLAFFAIFGLFAGILLGLMASFTYDALFTSSSKRSLLQKLRR